MNRTPRYSPSDTWAQAGRRYVPAEYTDLRETFARIRQEQARTTTPCVFDDH